ncbi:hypothetical protein N7492_000894 [Penicillium capsulatum]|uniref:F-box domain-containing protein n=1 Tax=Penicillium capsulatum TaxID=69766 RepID=A0A9W9LZ77_9EURO|nr:hypothetical protein N7492_000894 [Penicillium capsulatum]KAJ6130049.1 hypothetical protein N7512_002829 [Penicillium capsulatum]
MSLPSAFLEFFPTEILYSIVKYLYFWEVKSLSCVSRRMRDVCVPTLFRNISFEFSDAGFDVLESLLQSQLRQYVASIEYVVPKLLKPGKYPCGKHFNVKPDLESELLSYATFKTQILTPEDYVDVHEAWDDAVLLNDWDDLGYDVRFHTSYTLVYKTIRRMCAEQRQIIETGRDSALLSLAVQRLPKLTELGLVFCKTLTGVDLVESHLDLHMTMEKNTYEHHIQMVSNALNYAKKCGASVHSIQLIGLSFSSPWQMPDTQFLTDVLTELVKHVQNLQLIRSNSALESISHATMNIHGLDLCSIEATHSTLESFLRTNAGSVHSLGIHNVMVIDENLRGRANLSPDIVRNMTDIPVHKANRLPCRCSSQGCWKLVLNHDHHQFAPEATKRKWSA